MDDMYNLIELPYKGKWLKFNLRTLDSKGYLFGSQNEGEMPQIIRKHVGLLNQENNRT
jgi:hypothetical protein